MPHSPRAVQEHLRQRRAQDEAAAGGGAEARAGVHVAAQGRQNFAGLVAFPTNFFSFTGVALVAGKSLVAKNALVAGKLWLSEYFCLRARSACG